MGLAQIWPVDTLRIIRYGGPGSPVETETFGRPEIILPDCLLGGLDCPVVQFLHRPKLLSGWTGQSGWATGQSGSANFAPSSSVVASKLLSWTV